MKKKLSSIRGRQILVAGLALLVMASGYYRWTVDRGDALPTASEALPSEAESGEIADLKVADEEDDYFARARYERDCARSEATEILKTSAESSGDGKGENSQKLAFQAKCVESETAIESLVKAKGFSDCVAFVSEDGVSVVVKSDKLEAEGVARIKDIIIDKTGVKPTDIKISNKK